MNCPIWYLTPMVRTSNTLKLHSMIVWGCLSIFLAILILLGSCVPVQPLIMLPNNWDLPKSSKNIKTTSKYIFLASKCPYQLSKNDRNTHNPRAKFFFEVCIGFRVTLGSFKVYELELEIFLFFGHSNTISSIWKIAKNDIWTCKNDKTWQWCGSSTNIWIPKNPKSIRNEIYDAPVDFVYSYIPNKSHMLILQPQTSDRMSKLRFFVHSLLERFFGERNFKSVKQGQSVQKSRKSGFRVSMHRIRRKFRRTPSDHQKND